MKHLRIAVLPGDGIGPEIINEAVKVCDSIVKKFGHEIKWNYALVGAAAIDATGIDPAETAVLDTLNTLERGRDASRNRHGAFLSLSEVRFLRLSDVCVITILMYV